MRSTLLRNILRGERRRRPFGIGGGSSHLSLENILASPHHLAMLSAPLGVPLCLGMCRLTRRHPADQGSKNLSKFSSAYSLVHTSSFGRNCLMLREVLPTSRQPSRMTHDSLSRTVPSPRLLVLGRLRKTTVNRSGLALPPNRQIHPEPDFPSTLRAFAPYRRRDHKI